MTDARIAEAKRIGHAIHARLVPSEDLIYRIEDVLLFHRSRRGLCFFMGLNFCYFLLYFLVRPTSGSFVLGLLGFALFRPSRSDIKWMLSLFIDSTVVELPQGGSPRRFHVGQITAFIVSGWYFVRWSTDLAISAAERRDRSGITIVFTVLLTFFYFTWIVPDGILFWVLLNLVFLLPLTAQRLLL
jgi:hypothetical protein